jgi:RanBP1 domain
VGYLTNANSGLTGSSMIKPKLDNILSTRTTDTSEDSSRSIGGSTFPGLPKQGSSIFKNNVFAIANAAKTSDSQSASKSNNDYPTVQQGETAKPEGHGPEMGEVSDQAIEAFCPPHFNQRQRIQFFAAYRLRALNKGFLQSCDKLPQAADFGPSCGRYMKRREEILKVCRDNLKKFEEKLVGVDEMDANERPNKRSKPPGSSDVNPETDEGPRKRSKPLESAPLGQHLPKNSSPLKTQPVVSSGQTEHNLGQDEHVQNKSIFPLEPFSLKSGSTTPSGQFPSVFSFGSHSVTPVSPSPKGKRKAEVQLTQDDPTGEGVDGRDAPRKMAKVDKNTGGSETSNIFRNIVDGPGQAPISPEKRPGSPEKRSSSPEKKILSPRKTSDTGSISRPNPFSSLPAPSLEPANSLASGIFSPTVSIPSVSFSGADSTKAMLSNNSVSKPTIGEVPSNQSAPAAPTSDPLLKKPVSAETLANPLASNAGTNSPGIFNTSLFTKRPTSSQDPSGSQHPSTSASSIFSTNPPPVNASSNHLTLKATMPSVFSPQPTATTPINIFGAKSISLTTTSADTSSSSVANAEVIKPPTFGDTPVNFLAQFGNKSQENLEGAEAREMEKAKLEELDSDDDEEEWEAKWREKRAAEKKALEDLSKTKHAKFIPGKGFTFASTESAIDGILSSETAQVIPKSIFSQQSSAPPTSNVFSSVNGSAASSPGAASSTTSSVFDNLPPSKPVTFGTSNIFGHLSDADSGADSGQGNDADDDNTEDGEEDESSASNEEQDENEKNDKTYDPNTEGSRPSTPSTPPEETGPGIASAKKSANYLGAISGTSTPTSTGSLFDRITKDSNGNPIRQIHTDDKENAEPSTANTYNGKGTSIFARLGNSKSPGDNTWKPESPIKFSTSTPPSVSITAPTPTKASPFAGLFSSAAAPGSSTASTPASSFPGLFGNTGAPKPPSLFAHLSNSDGKPATVGFGFDATSTTASSLLPSAAGSTATSRATSPGGTTDGETPNEAAHDPDAEHHEQINLAASGPGEENEEVIFEVRAKALKHTSLKESNGSPWLTKGIGPLRILKHKETGATRILLRADPSGTVVVNKGILAQVNYKATGKTVKVLSASDDGKGLETWVLQVKAPGIAEELASVLESNKPDA